MISLTWTQWVSNISKGDVYFFINTSPTSDSIKRFYSHNWVDEAIPLYRGTGLDHLTEISPWLIKIKSISLYHLAKELDECPLEDKYWGWAYHSHLNWKEQINHWQFYQMVTVDNELVHLRIFDPRIAEILLPNLKEEDWLSLMYPVNDIFIQVNKESLFFEYPKDILKRKKHDFPLKYIFPLYLLEAWRNSLYATNLVVENLILDFWEENGDLANLLFSRENNIRDIIYKWVSNEKVKNTDIAYLTDKNLLNHLLNIKLINKEEL